MLEQLKSSIEWDCYQLNTPELLSGVECLENKIKSVEWEIKYHQEKAKKKKKKRIEDQNNWLRLLRESVSLSVKK